MNDKAVIFYFTGTGNTRLVASAASAELESRGYSCSLEEIKKGSTGKDIADDTTVGIAFPVYGLSLPGMVRNFIKSLPVSRDGESFIIANAHTNTGNSVRQARKLLKARGYKLLGSTETFTPSSSIITEETEPESIADEMRKKAVLTAGEFADKLIKGKAEIAEGRCGGKEKMVSMLFRAAMPGAVLKKVEVTESCTGCGTCESICPAGNIKITDGRPVWGKNCEVCMRCINLCPAGAIEMMNSHGRTRYREPSFNL